MIKQAQENNLESAFTSPTTSKRMIKNSSISTFKTNPGKNTLNQIIKTNEKMQSTIGSNTTRN